MRVNAVPINTESRPAAPPRPAPFLAVFDEMKDAVNAALAARAKALKVEIGPHSALGDAIEYSMLQPGKRLRPVLVLAACRLLRAGDPPAAAAGRGSAAAATMSAAHAADAAALAAACAIECIHTFSLVHDDLPAMDDDDLRRGVPTCHKVYGDALAILAGDWLQTYALRILIAEAPSPAIGAALLRSLADGTLGMIEGQAADVAGETAPPTAERVEFIHVRKTARLIEAATRMGAICAGASEPQIAALSTYGRRLGLAFQIADDILDATSTTETLGKRAGKDADQSKQTYPAVFGLEASRAQAQQEVEAAIAALAEFGPAAEFLREVARFVIAREK